MSERQRRYPAWLHSNWPSPDHEEWQAAFFPGDGLTTPGPLVGFKPRTVENAELAWGRYVDYQRRKGSLIDATRVGERLNEKDLVGFGRDLLNDLKISTALVIFTSMARAVHAMDPQADTTLLHEIITRLARLAKPTRQIDMRLISPPELLSIGEAMMDEADSSPIVTYRTKHLYRDGLLIMWEALCPLRRGTMHKIKIGEHLVSENGGLRVEFSADVMKGNRAFGTDLPKLIEPRLLRYIQHYRPQFLKPGEEDSGHLFLSNLGTQMFPGNLSRIVKDNLLRRTGKNFSFHMFRHAAASFVADQAPHRLHDARKLLHHRRLTTTWTYYVRKRQKEALDGYQSAVKDLLARERGRGTKGQSPTHGSAPKPSRPRRAST